MWTWEFAADRASPWTGSSLNTGPSPRPLLTEGRICGGGGAPAAYRDAGLVVPSPAALGSLPFPVTPLLGALHLPDGLLPWGLASGCAPGGKEGGKQWVSTWNRAVALSGGKAPAWMQSWKVCSGRGPGFCPWPAALFLGRVNSRVLSRGPCGDGGGCLPWTDKHRTHITDGVGDTPAGATRTGCCVRPRVFKACHSRGPATVASH